VASNLTGSTKFSSQRFAHPFFLPAKPEDRTKFNGHSRITDWTLDQTGPVPPPKNGGMWSLSDVIGNAGVKQISDLGELRFHALGDTGVGHAVEAETVSDQMSSEYHAGAGGLNPAFLLHLGDVLYGPNKNDHYVERFYSPYRHYPGKILAIPGNHDGESTSAADKPSLTAFIKHFCAEGPDPDAAQTGIYRTRVNQPGIYWCLDTPVCRIIGLYSNRTENPGYLEGDDETGKLDKSQIEWLRTTLKTIAEKKDGKALVIVTHHPPFSQGSHSGSTYMSDTIDEACENAGVTPDAFLSGHSHNYQHYTRRWNGKEVPYVVAGTGGISVQAVQPASGQIIDTTKHVTYDASTSVYGYLAVGVTEHQMTIDFKQAGSPKARGQAPKRISLDLRTHRIR
jgi:hypothetical protein